ncbi:hypothetical protein NECAME_03627 [Necator americanus]|uniref:AAA+ ATPase domain-containing protein n=1 Tax=Necator americanus TaxID=51031 RepID=W2T2R9_NECAM|nr:hypothetical protein NECAME_03627 [Necator americanus]ETN75854.1 hypothetical protein NECAME_03627 [Necator americanus]
MDDEDFNVISQIPLDDADFEYPDVDTNEPSASNVAVVNALNGTGQKKRRLIDEDPFKMPPDEIFTHALDWHMRMPLTFEEHENARGKRLHDDLAANQLLQRISHARAKRMRAMGEHFGASQHPFSDDEMEKENQVMETPPIDGSAWLGMNSDENDERHVMVNFHLRAKKRLLAEREGQHVEAAQPEVEDEGRTGSSMWVNKYAPRVYTDLLSDDGINRHLMSWVKLWDECVFKRKIVNLPKEGSSKEKDLLTLDAGKLRRPTHKIVLLSGPAGLGKTTLANVVARQAGYAVVELNASDSRNVPDFEKALEGAVRTSRTITQGTRPNCLILDEIDGAPAEAVRFLVKAVQATGKKAIRRPIICICNSM